MLLARPRAAGRGSDPSRTAEADGGLAALDDRRDFPDAAVGLKHLIELHRVGLDVVVGDGTLLLVRLQRIVSVGSARFSVDDDLAHCMVPP